MNSRVCSTRKSNKRDTMLNPLQNFFFGFAGLVTAAAAWSIWGGDMFPQTEDPKGDPQKWSEEEMRAWLNNVR
jgi:hypothetical protein